MVWAANMAAIEIHAPMALARDLDTPRAVVFDFDPGAPATIVDCCEIALAVREVLDAVGLEGWCKTSGSKGLQLYVPLNADGVTHEGAADFALAVGQVLERQMPKRVTTVMAKAERPGKIFVDWSQNAHHKTTIAPYSLRARPDPTVSTPVTWDEVEACAAGDARAAVHERRGAGAGGRTSATCSRRCSPSRRHCRRSAAEGGADARSRALSGHRCARGGNSSGMRHTGRRASAKLGRGAARRSRRAARCCGRRRRARARRRAVRRGTRARPIRSSRAACRPRPHCPRCPLVPVTAEEPDLDAIEPDTGRDRRRADVRRRRRRHRRSPTPPRGTVFDERVGARLGAQLERLGRRDDRRRGRPRGRVRRAGGGHRPRSVEPTDRFRIASISKTITAITTLRLVEQGLLTLDDPVGQQLIDHLGVQTADPDAAGITVRGLLSHTAGLGKGQDLMFGNGAPSYADAAREALTSSVGRWRVQLQQPRATCCSRC